MSSIHETAYPRFKPELTQRELEDVYAPSVEDSKFIRRNAKTPAAKLYLALLIGARSIPARDHLDEEKRHHSRVRCMEAIRAHVKIKPITGETHTAILNAATEAAQTKQELADIINVIIEELVRQRFELPAFSTLNRKALAVRSEVNDRYFKTLADPLPPAEPAQSRIDIGRPFPHQRDSLRAGSQAKPPRLSINCGNQRQPEMDSKKNGASWLLASAPGRSPK